MLHLEGRELQMIITTDESLGNCPKYITIRDIKYHPREGVVRYQVPDMTEGSLPREALEIIEQCDGVFLAARHLAAEPKEVDDMDLNHRGGKPGTNRCMHSPPKSRIRSSRRGWTNSDSSRLQRQPLLLYTRKYRE